MESLGRGTVAVWSIMVECTCSDVKNTRKPLHNLRILFSREIGLINMSGPAC